MDVFYYSGSLPWHLDPGIHAGKTGLLPELKTAITYGTINNYFVP